MAPVHRREEQSNSDFAIVGQVPNLAPEILRLCASYFLVAFWDEIESLLGQLVELLVVIHSRSANGDSGGVDVLELELLQGVS